MTTVQTSEAFGPEIDSKGSRCWCSEHPILKVCVLQINRCEELLVEGEDSIPATLIVYSQGT